MEADSAIVIGQTYGDAEYILPNVVGGAVLTDGTIALAVFSPGLFELRYYDPEGIYLRSAGRYGEGPFEVGQLGGYSLRMAGDSVLVLGLDHRVSIFGPRGSPGRATRLRNIDPMFVPIGHVRGDQVALWSLLPAREDRNGWRTLRRRAIVYDVSGGTVSDLGEFESGRTKRVEGGGSLWRPFYASAYGAAGSGDIWLGASASRDIIRYDAAGTPALRLRLGFPEIAVDDNAQDKFADFVMDHAQPGRQRAWRPFLGQVEFPAHMPYFQGLIADRHGNVWVRRYEPRYSQAPERWEVFDRSGRWLRTVVIPFEHLSKGSCRRGVRDVPCEAMLEVGDDYVLMKQLEQNNVLRVSKFPLVRVR